MTYTGEFLVQQNKIIKKWCPTNNILFTVFLKRINL